ncbi:MAG: hypothetical protein CMJ22_08195 [Phycisphaerae bacterium]|nr:hypothetical protein [Phycisphaerae bacterium]|tara:strand:- start:325 stop:558 length:234 start_codon:yes stop_codon:yes gene_type:complete
MTVFLGRGRASGGGRRAIQAIFGMGAESFKRGAGHHSNAFAMADERAADERVTRRRDPGRRRRGGVEQLRHRRFERG